MRFLAARRLLPYNATRHNASPDWRITSILAIYAIEARVRQRKNLEEDYTLRKIATLRKTDRVEGYILGIIVTRHASKHLGRKATHEPKARCHQRRYIIVASTNMRKARRFATEIKTYRRRNACAIGEKPRSSTGASRNRMSEGFDKSRVGTQSGNVGESSALVSEAPAFLRKMTSRLVAHLMRRFQAIH